ncbi:hypothetical protein BDV36DRAFT_124285 [Aspergillus pseudocaelatus]|uniref:Uncharacterized protein n=1 Tax=Aspergillus pseudocaelatus TaxID=1825620 RepID=A0ABQ6WVY2_9EURO|nr:hypothetical protein BDV36DRAFT_124285 [Aspergillus pseudocaelatus]
MSNFAAYGHRHELIDMAIMARISASCIMFFPSSIFFFYNSFSFTISIVVFQFSVSINWARVKILKNLVFTNPLSMVDIFIRGGKRRVFLGGKDQLVHNHAAASL